MDETKNRERKWRLGQGLTLTFPVVIAAVLVIILIAFQIPKYSPVSPDKAAKILTELGYTPYERTEALRKEFGLGSEIKTGISAASNTLEIDYFRADGSKGAASLREALRSYVRTRGWGYAELLKMNYLTMSCSSGSHHILFVQLRNTALLIHYEDSQAAQVAVLLDALGYPGADRLP